MVQGLIGKKVGMTQIFDEAGHAVGVTVVELGPCTVIRKKKDARVQIGFEPAKEKNMTKPKLGQFTKAGTRPFRVLKEFEVLDPESVEVGQEVNLDMFSVGERVKVTGTSKGKGFAGVMKRWNFGGGRKTHGSRSHRIPGAVGQCAWPARIFRGKKMPGRLGGQRVTLARVEVVDIRADENLILLRGPIPGADGGIVTIRKQ
jgi:large subunit ribosomal protein L3